ncbi:hypothetical protein CPSG_07034, partial [Coccidioides posadasii str. Silveira]
VREGCCFIWAGQASAPQPTSLQRHRRCLTRGPGSRSALRWNKRRTTLTRHRNQIHGSQTSVQHGHRPNPYGQDSSWRETMANRDEQSRGWKGVVDFSFPLLVRFGYFPETPHACLMLSMLITGG